MGELFETLEHADVLVGLIRAQATLEAQASAPAPVPASAPAPFPAPAPAPLPEGYRYWATPYPSSSTESPVRRIGLRTASVPAVLLGLGALCLLVAAVTFLAVAWSWMGVGGRTAVLVGLTMAAAGAGVVLGRRGLRVAAECLTAVSLGLVALDVAGAITAGWLGSPDWAASTALIGTGVAVVSGAILVARSRLVVPQVGVVLGLVLAAAGVAVTTGRDGLVGFVAVLVLGAIASVGALAGARVLHVTAAVAAGASWVWLLVTGLEDGFSNPSLHGLWADGIALPLLGASLLLLGLAAVPMPAEQAVHTALPDLAGASASGAATLLTLVVALPALDEGTTAVGLALLAALVVWSAVAAKASREVAFGPLALVAVPAVVWTGGHVLVAAERVWGLGDPFVSTANIRLAPLSPDTSPLLLVPLVAAALAATWVITRLPHDRFVTAALLVGAAAATLALYAVPLAAVVLVLAVAAVVASWIARPVLATAVALVSVSAALPSAGLTALACAASITVAAVLIRSREPVMTLLGGLLLPLAVAGLVWSGAEAAHVAVDQRAVPVLVVLGLLAIAIPRAEVEASAASAGLVAAYASLAVASDQLTDLAVDLTVAGVLVTLSSLVHSERRVLAWPGGALLAAATWVRLADLGVEAPEAYTLPSAVVLILVGLHRLWRTPGASSAALLPGLTLATVPSLLWVMADPAGPRAVLLGVACLGLVLGGAQLRWSAPLAVGGIVGGLLVIREVAPYATDIPQWVMIGLAGTILTVVGVTWESRLLDVRRATTYLGRLR